MKATRHNGRSGKHGTYDAKHNDRRFDVENSEHIDAERTKMNVYWDCYQGYSLPNDKDERARFTFTEIEKAYYVEKYSDHVDGQNERNRKARHYDRVKTIDAILENNKTCPEETLLQLGNMDGAVSADVLAQVSAEYFEEFNRRYGSHVHILDWALHLDEATPHIHVEAVQNREKVEFQLDTLLWGTEDEKEAVIHDLGKGVEDIERRVREYRRNQGTVNHNRQRSCEAVH